MTTTPQRSKGRNEKVRGTSEIEQERLNNFVYSDFWLGGYQRLWRKLKDENRSQKLWRKLRRAENRFRRIRTG